MTTVGQLIEMLQKFDPNAPVALDDWNEGYLSPSSVPAGQVQGKVGQFWANPGDEKQTEGYFVQIGDCGI
jgi:hypothetical protein